MKSTVVPAQITTVEDKIAGSLNFIQIILLVFSLIIGTAFYGLIPPKLHLSSPKIALMIIQFAIFGTLALRYQGKILADWLVIILRFKARPRIYIYTKNDVGSREILGEPTHAETENSTKTNIIKTKHKKRQQVEYPEFANSEAIVSIKASKKGGLDVVYREA